MLFGAVEYGRGEQELMWRYREGYVAITPLGIHFDPSHFEDYRVAHEKLNSWAVFQAPRK